MTLAERKIVIFYMVQLEYEKDYIVTLIGKEVPR